MAYNGESRSDAGSDHGDHDGREVVRYVDDYPPLVSMPFGLPDRCEVRQRHWSGSPANEARHPYSYSGTRVHVNINVPQGQAIRGQASPDGPPLHGIARGRASWLGGCWGRAFSVGVLLVLWLAATWSHRVSPDQATDVQPLPISTGPFDEELTQLAQLNAQFTIDVEVTRASAMSAAVRDTFEGLLPRGSALSEVIARLRRASGAYAGLDE